jgi:methyl-accepting chemotaxis protein
MREEKVVVKKVNSIMFQIAVTNLLLLVAFFIVMAFVMTSMKTTTTTSIEMFETMMKLTYIQEELAKEGK